jgi:ribosome-interacting GTPase 1
MNITTNHPASSYGVPVILDDAGEVMTRGNGVKAVKAKLRINNADMATLCNVSIRTVEGWLQNRHVNAAALNVMGDMIKPARPTQLIERLIERLEHYQAWRRDADTEQPNPTRLGLDLDAASELLKRIP